MRSACVEYKQTMLHENRTTLSNDEHLSNDTTHLRPTSLRLIEMKQVFFGLVFTQSRTFKGDYREKKVQR